MNWNKSENWIKVMLSRNFVNWIFGVLNCWCCKKESNDGKFDELVVIVCMIRRKLFSLVVEEELFG